MKICSFIITFILFFNPITSSATENIIATIPALASIIENITDNPVKVIINDSSVACAHDYQLKPSDALTISDADFIVTVGREFEPFYNDILKLKNEKAVLIELATDKNIKLLPVRNDNLWKDEDNYEHHKHHKHHEKSVYDYHFWLDPDNALVVARIITDRLTTLNPKKKNFYLGNLQDFAKRISALNTTLGILSKNKNIKYLISHDSIRYIEEKFHLSSIGTISYLESGELSIKKALETEKIIKENNVSLLLIEGNNYPKALERLKKDTGIKIKNIDIIGTTLSAGKDLYFDLLTALIETIYL